MKCINSLIIALLIQLFVSPQAFSQDISQLDKSVVPPSPTAYELGKFGYSPVGMYSGTASYSIPLYELNGKNLTLPISLSYYSNGIKVDQLASSVGMGWSLNAGGVITRIIRGTYDEKDNFPKPFPQDITTLSIWDRYDYVANHIDSEPDLYAYNFSGHSGKFIIDKSDGKIYTIPYTNLKVVKLANMWFEITTEDGSKYTFDNTERTVETNSCTPNDNRNNPNRNVYTSSFLSKIEHPAGDQINFLYIQDTLYYTSGIEQTVSRRMLDPYAPEVSCPIDEGNITPCDKNLRIYGKILSEISYDNITIKFNSTRNRLDATNRKIDGITIKNNNTGEILKTYAFNYIYSSNNSRMFLSSIVSKASNLSPIGTYFFDYDNINDLPARLSYAQDHWGYYNGALYNTGFIPITTGDSNKFLEFSWGETLLQKFPYFQNVDREPHYPYSQKGILIKITYPTGGTTVIEYEPNNYLNGTTNVETGGLRIKRVKTKESITSLEQIERFYYTNDLNNLSKTSCWIPKKPRYYYSNIRQCSYTYDGNGGFTIPNIPYSSRFANLSSSSLNSIYNCSGSHVAYSAVTKSYGENFENGGVIFIYQNNVDQDGSYVNLPEAQPYMSDAVELAPKSNESWNAGTLISQTTLKKNGSGQIITLSKEQYTYNSLFVTDTSDSRFSKDISAYSICQFDNGQATTIANCSGNDYTDPRCPCYQKPSGSSYNLVSIMGYTIVKYTTYCRWGYLKSKIVTQYDENGLNPVAATTNYYYDNSAHAQLTREETTDSKGNLIKKVIKYPQDYTTTSYNIGTLNTKKIINIPLDIRKYVGSTLAEGQQIMYNIYGQPTDIYKVENSGTDVTFSQSNPYTFTHKSTFKYDDVNHTVVQTTKDNDYPTSYIWGYNQTLPVAKIVNIAQSQISSSIITAIKNRTFTNGMTYSSIQTDLNFLKTQLSIYINNSAYLVTLYTYNPLMGMTSQTDPNGVTTYYEYDTFGRLKLVKNDDGDIKNRNTYHYKQ